MATTCGIHIDGRRYHLIALDGSARKHKVTAAVSGEIGIDEDPITSVSQALRRAIKDHKIKKGEVQLAVDSGLAAFRTLTLPFDDRAKIEDVLKFEVENDLPQWDIDDVLVDFVILNSKPGVESTLLVTALPKDRMEMQLAACEAGGLEAQEAELDGTALFDAAYESGCLAEDAAQILVHVGDSSTTVVVADGGKINSIRAIRAGAHPGTVATAATEIEDTAEPRVDGEDGEEGISEGLALEQAAEAERRLRQTAQRIRRELGRTLSAAQTINDIEAIYICGYELPDLVRDEIFDTPIAPLEVLSEDENVECPTEAVIAYGAALHAMGAGSLSPSLRREELRFTGKFERLELPLAVFSLFLFTLLVVQLMVTRQQIQWRDAGPPDDPGDMQIWMIASNRYVFPDPDDLVQTRLTDPPEKIAEYAKRAQTVGDERRTKFAQIKEISRQISNEVINVKKELGQVSDIEQPQSALEATTLVMGILRKQKDSSDLRFGMRHYKAEYQSGSGRKADAIRVSLEMDFFADSENAATRHYQDFLTAMKAEVWCLSCESGGSEGHDDGKGINAKSIKILVDLKQANADKQEEEKT